MIIIFSISKYDQSTEHVISWLLYKKELFLRINFDELENNEIFNFNYNSNDKSEFTFKSKILNFEVPNIIWYRRTSFIREDFYSLKHIKITFENAYNYLIFRNMEWNNFIQIFYSLFPKNTIWFDHPNKKINKIEVLKIAKSCNLKIPNFYITNNTKNLPKDKSLITKPLSEATKIDYLGLSYMPYTSIFKKIFPKFLPSLFQEKIEKKFEIRTFYLDGECFSMAIFSQNDKKTQIDFRQYNRKKPNRTVPYKLPSKIENKLTILMNKIELRNGSIDIIKGIDNKYYFLEVNPVGQFGMTSKPCNYNLEKRICEKLIELNNEAAI